MITELPTEIRLEIARRLRVADMARLSQCSKKTRSEWEPCLLSLPIARMRLMRWGCSRGQAWAVEKAISHGHKPRHGDMESALWYIIEAARSGSDADDDFAQFVATRDPFPRMRDPDDRLPWFAPHPGPSVVYSEALQRVPLLVAAVHMAETGSTYIFDLALAYYGDINCHDMLVTFVAGPPWPWKEKRYLLTPVMAYVLAEWDGKPRGGPGRGGRRLTPSQGLQYLFHHGAVVEKAMVCPEYRYSPPHCLLRLLWHRKGGFDLLLDDEGRAMAETLARKGAAAGQIGNFICWQSDRGDTVNVNGRLVDERWGRLLDLLLVDRNFELVAEDELNHALFRLLLSIMRDLAEADLELSKETTTDAAPPSWCRGTRNWGYPVTIRKLMDLGADLNWRPAWGTFAGKSVLEAMAGDHLHRPEHPEPAGGVDRSRQRWFVQSLIRIGMRPLDGTSMQQLLDQEPRQEAWARFVHGRVPDEALLLWHPNAGRLFEGVHG